MTPLTLTVPVNAFPPQRRGIALGVWSGISGTAVALGPLVGGAVTQTASWHWISWLNVPVGVVLGLLAAVRFTESRGPARRLDLRGVTLVSGGLFGVVFGLVRSQSQGWTSPEVLIALVTGVALVLAFIVYELRTAEPMLPMKLASRCWSRRAQR